MGFLGTGRFQSIHSMVRNVVAEPSRSAWLGRRDSNPRLTGSNPVALPLGYDPTSKKKSQPPPVALAGLSHDCHDTWPAFGLGRRAAFVQSRSQRPRGRCRRVRKAGPIEGEPYPMETIASLPCRLRVCSYPDLRLYRPLLGSRASGSHLPLAGVAAAYVFVMVRTGHSLGLAFKPSSSPSRTAYRRAINLHAARCGRNSRVAAAGRRARHGCRIYYGFYSGPVL